MGIKALRKGFVPVPYSMRDVEGKRVGMNNQAKAAAKFLGQKIWGQEKPPTTAEKRHSKVIEEHVRITTSEITM